MASGSSGRSSSSSVSLTKALLIRSPSPGPTQQGLSTPPGSHEQIEPSGELTTGRKQTYSDGRGTDGSNPIPFSGESSELQSSAAAPGLAAVLRSPLRVTPDGGG